MAAFMLINLPSNSPPVNRSDTLSTRSTSWNTSLAVSIVLPSGLGLDVSAGPRSRDAPPPYQSRHTRKHQDPGAWLRYRH
jgi:hypothetical protein